MENRALITPVIFIFILFLLSCCTSKSEQAGIATDTLTIAKGEALFSQNCSACHNFRQDGIGPQLGGITRTVSTEWIKEFIKNPKAVVESGDARGEKLLGRYKTLMPAFAHYSDDELNALLAYMHTQKTPDTASDTARIPEVVNPIPQAIEASNFVVDVEYIAEIPASGNDGFKTRITKLDHMPGNERLFMLDIRGKLYELQDRRPRVYMDMAKLKPKFIDKPGLATGFGSFAFHPQFLKNGLLYTSHTEPSATRKADFSYSDTIPVALQWVISEWKTNSPKAFPFEGTSSRELFRIDMVTGMHGVQELTFNPNAKEGDQDYGLLYVGIGDGACVESGYPFLVHNIEKPWGSIFRIDPTGNNSANKQYGIPPTNPFAKNENEEAVGELYAYGFRNPHRITWTKSGHMLASNVGQANIESINLVLPGHNYGWPIREGTFLVNPFGDITKVYPLPANDAQYNVTYPAAQYDHDEGLAVTGGFEYTGSTHPELKNKYLFGDMNNGRLYYIDLAEVRPGRIATIREWKIALNGNVTTTAELCGSTRVDLRFGKDARGNVYFFSKQDGKIWRLAGAHTARQTL